MSSFGALLRRSRRGRGLSLAEVSARSGVSSATLSRWEKGLTRPRLEALGLVMDALELTPGERREALAHLEDRRTSPRRQAAALSTLDDPPGAVAPGELIQALRRRQRWTGRELARRAGVTASAVLRWERSRTLPSPESMERLADLLVADPGEREALRRAASGSLPVVVGDPPEACEERLAALRDAISAGRPVSADLEFLALEARLLALLPRRESVRPLLSETLNWHGEWLLRQGRCAEAEARADQAVELHRHERPFPATRIGTVCLSVHAMRGRSPGRKERAAHDYLRPWLEGGEWPLHASVNMRRDLAWFLAAMGRTEEAVRLSLESLRDAERVGHPDPVRTGRFTHARLLIEAGSPREAETWLPSQDSNPHPTHWDALAWADVLLILGDRMGAAAWLSRFYAIVEEHRLEHLRPQGDSLARRLS